MQTTVPASTMCELMKPSSDPKQTLSSSFTEGSNLSLHEVEITFCSLKLVITQLPAPASRKLNISYCSHNIRSVFSSYTVVDILLFGNIVS